MGILRCVAVAVTVVVGASSLTNVAGAEPVGGPTPKHPDITVPKGPFVQSKGRTDTSVPGDARHPSVPSKKGGVTVPRDPNAEVLERLASTPPDRSVSAPAQPGGSETTPVLKVADGPVDELAEVLTNPDGSRVLRTHSERTFYKDGSGRFAKIDVRLKATADGAVVSTGDSVSYRFDTSGVTVEAQKGKPFRFSAEGGAQVAPVVSDDGRSVTFVEKWPGVDVTYSVGASGLKEHVVLKRRPDRTDFPFVVDAGTKVTSVDKVDGRVVPAGTMSVSVNGSDAGLVVAPPVALDKAGAKVPGAVSKIALADRGRDGAGRQRLGLSADPGWLNGLAADAYPVVLDPIVGVSTPMAQWANLRWFWPWGTGATAVACTDPPGPCPRQLGAHQDGNIFREHLGFNLGGLWSVIDLNPTVSVASAKLTVAASQVPSPVRDWYAYDDMPAGQELSYWASTYGMTHIGTTTLDGAGNGQIDFTGRFNTWRAERAGGATKWNTPTLAFHGEENQIGYLVLGNISLDVTFQNRAPIATAVSPEGEIDNVAPTLVGSGSDPDGDAFSYQFRMCEWDYATNAEVGCVLGPWQAGSTIPAASVKPLFWNRTYRWYVAVRDGSTTTLSSPKWFRASVPPPTAPTWRGGDDPYSGFKGGVNLVTGNYFATQLDASVVSVGLRPMSWCRWPRAFPGC